MNIPSGLLVVLALGVIGCSRPRPTRYIVDAGFNGWVRVSYSRPEAPPLPAQKGFNLINVPFIGIFSTSDKMSPGWDGSEFYSVTASGKLAALPTAGENRQVWGAEKMRGTDGDWESFYIGTQDDFTKSAKTPVEMEIEHDKARPREVIAEPVPTKQ